jgi:hypothetical protein
MVAIFQNGLIELQSNFNFSIAGLYCHTPLRITVKTKSWFIGHKMGQNSYHLLLQV